MTLKVYSGANGYYVSDEGADGYHIQPPQHDAKSWHDTRGGAEAAMRELEHEQWIDEGVE